MAYKIDVQKKEIIFYSSKLLLYCAFVLSLTICFWSVPIWKEQSNMMALDIFFFGVFFLSFFGAIWSLYNLFNKKPLLVLGMNGLEIANALTSRRIAIGSSSFIRKQIPWNDISGFNLKLLQGEGQVYAIEIECSNGEKILLSTGTLPITSQDLIKVLQDYRSNGATSATTLLNSL